MSEEKFCSECSWFYKDRSRCINCQRGWLMTCKGHWTPIGVFIPIWEMVYCGGRG